MNNFKPDFGTERKIISILMNRPENVYRYKVLINDFEVPDHKAVVQSIKDNPSATDYLQWFTAAKQQKVPYSQNQTDFQNLGSGFVTDGNIKMLLKTLHHHHLNSLFNQALMNYQDNPSMENSHKAMDIMRQQQNADAKANDGSLHDTIEQMRYDLYNDRPVGMKFADYPTFNKLAGEGFSPSLNIIAARTSIGKSAFALNLAMNALKNNPTMHVSIFSLEMNKRELIARIIAKMTAVKPSLMKNPNQLISQDAIKQFVDDALTKLDKLNIEIYDNTHSLDDIESIMTSEASMENRNEYLPIIDYLGLIELENSGQMARYQQLATISRNLKIISNDYEIPIIALAQLNRQLENRDDKKAKVSDIAGSGAIEQDANAIIMLQKNGDDESVRDVTFAKNRDGELGTIHYKFRSEAMRFIELDDQGGKH